ncbi:MAG TPA: SpoIID/LytB domain-containing protein, partial [Candidatus Nitrosotenuis sp.]|nr:SpoIID/LytB domain-containing protein [Candidatus Nitrosotenuis sp.]
GFDFCDTTHCQDARFSAESPRLRAAVNDTEGELLWHEGRPAAAFYHRDCGGLTEAAKVPWPDLRAPYLRQTQDTFCTARGRSSWHSEVSFGQLRAALLAAQIRAPQKLTNVVVIERTPSGRVAKLRLDAHNSPSQAIRIAAEPFRRAIGFSLGWEKLRSDLYDLTISGDKIRFSGHGAGHGVGLCQLGAARMGELGRSYADILSFYYPGTRMGLTASGLDWQILGDERLRLFTTQPATDQSILLVAPRALREAERLAGWQLSGGAQLRVFPTIDAYRNATGQPGWVAASTRGRTIRLQPFNKLNSMGTLERTLRHEFLHVLVESRARNSLPLWFREGLVLVLEAKESARENFPVTLTDAELERMLEAPPSRAEMDRAYRAARARVLLLIQKYGREAVIGWLERGLPREAG